MVNIADKNVTKRFAHARSVVLFPPNVLDKLIRNTNAVEIVSKKGPVFATAIVAGTMAVKRTHELIPFCHPMLIEGCKFDIKMEGDDVIIIDCYVEVTHKTGVEMEAMTGASVAALTIYDMCKALSHNIVIQQTHLVKKTGGKSDFIQNEASNQKEDKK